MIFVGCDRYRENPQRLSRIYRDQPQTPLEQAVYRMEYVIRHNGAPHLRSGALDVTWYQYLLLDVIAVLVLVIGSVVLNRIHDIKTSLEKSLGCQEQLKRK